MVFLLFGLGTKLRLALPERFNVVSLPPRTPEPLDAGSRAA